MFTPQEIQERSDSLEKAVFGGYSMSAVEDLLTPLQKDYAALYKENAVLKSKMKVLVDRMEEYRKQEESLNRAILTAQKTADDMVAEAERKCAKMVAETEQRLRQRSEDLQQEIAAQAEQAARAKENIQKEIDAETQRAAKERAELQNKIAAEGERVVLAKKAAAAFIVEIEDRVQQQLSQLERIKQMDLTVKEEPQEAPKPEKPKAPAAEKAPAVKTLPVKIQQAKAAPVQTPVAAVPEAPAQKERVVVQEEPPRVLSESEMSKQIEENLSRILAVSMQAEDKTSTMGDTQVISLK